MKKIFLTTLILLVISCSSTNNRNIFLGKDYQYEILQDENIIELSAAVKDRYFNLIPSYENTQIPLYRCINAPDYAIFIGIALNTEDLSTFLNSSNPENGSFSTDSVSYAYRKLDLGKPDLYLAEFIFKAESNFYYLIAETTDSLTYKNSLSKNALKERIINSSHEKK